MPSINEVFAEIRSGAHDIKIMRKFDFTNMDMLRYRKEYKKYLKVLKNPYKAPIEQVGVYFGSKQESYYTEEEMLELK